MQDNIIATELQKFNLSDLAIAQYSDLYMPLEIQGIDDKEGYKLVKEARSLIKGTRVDIEKTRKALKEDSLRYGRAVDAEAKRITALLLPIEDHLDRQQRAIDDELERIKQEAEAKRKAALQTRIDAFFAVGKSIDVALLMGMSEESYQAALQAANAMYRAEQERLTKEARAKAEAAEILRQQEEAAKAEIARKQVELDEERRIFNEEKKALEEKIAAEENKQPRDFQATVEIVATKHSFYIGQEVLVRRTIMSLPDIDSNEYGLSPPNAVFANENDIFSIDILKN